jgi:carboxymethylenebutenolidase
VGEFDIVAAPGTEARVYEAGETSLGAGVVVLHPWWGLNSDVLGFADRLVDAGYVVAAPDLYHGDVVDTVEAADERSGRMDGQEAAAIVGATVDDLAGKLGPDARVAVVGFSMGAALAIAADRPSIAGTVLYYGTGDPAEARGTAPVLGHFADRDPYEDGIWVADFEVKLRSAGHDVTFHHYAATGHWFAEPSRDAYRPEAADLAFERTLAFLERSLHS